MALNQPISVILACDYFIQFSILDVTETISVNVLGLHLSWMLKRSLSQPDSAVLIPEKTTANGGIIVSGIFNSVPALNQQIVTVLLHAVETELLKPLVGQHELKCMDFPETVYTNGSATLIQGVHRT